MRRRHVPGVAIAVLEGGSVYWTQCAGVRKANSADPVSDSTIFQVASVSKLLTAVGVLAIARRRLIHLDEDVNHQLRSWKLPGDHGGVTPRLLAAHAGGVNIHGFSGYQRGSRLPTAIQILNGHAPATNHPIRVVEPPGRVHRYSGGGYQVLQQLVSDVSHGRSFETEMHELVFGPIRCRSSGFWQPLRPGSHADIAQGHDGQGAPLPGGWLDYPALGAAGCWQTATDLARVLGEIHRAIAGHSAILSTDGARALVSPALPLVGSQASLGGAIEGSGRALRLRKLGSQTGYNAEAILVPATGQGAAVLTNADGGARLVAEIVNMVATAQSWPKIEANLW
jgi:CubicO group peptidase (beta-lactamase class C family)